MKTQVFKWPVLLMPFLFFLCCCFSVNAQEEPLTYKEFKGTVVDNETGNDLVFATLTVENTNISSITNSEGEFALKVPVANLDNNVTVSFLGYEQKTMPLSILSRNGNKIHLDPVSIELAEVDVSVPKDALALVKSMLKKNGENYFDTPVKMTAFYRETIKKRRKDASLSEAVAYIYKQPNSSGRRDIVDLYKSRKSTNYSRLDTIALKLQGGPFTPLFVDIMKYPEYIFADDLINQYSFSFSPSTTINSKPVYVVNFKQHDYLTEPLFYGKLFIDMETQALASAVFNLNVENRRSAGELLVRRKPSNIRVYPTEASYRVDYRIQNGKWYYGYGNVQLAFVVDRKRKLFNSKYYVSSEMAITDWQLDGSGKDIKRRERVKPTIIIADEASGFSDPEFWGAYNVIEPEKSIESAISKIQRQLKREKS
ncbi:carboxypeptidase-like regulatory domain-containing protein [Galbibacter sp. EGI 63066]|uniref:carboxypeptidase-like regulatory domain-containing protein n=1 Tax=Galbibacter sp. EGI 63066 TaxID=2993559 RepID=UPI00224897B9|nr:carboxypeptidase-like regulatory domain-containing protein [Galbibacter sp. EGI 63066]MCX2681378.1 carboxypeptidase-like regulatory domain-containing protein [Galbibacter sp. EGI 63066]